MMTLLVPSPGGQYSISINGLSFRPRVRSCIKAVRAPKTAAKTPQFQKILAATQAAHPDVRILVRPSGTEPVVRVLAEGEDKGALEEVVRVLERALGGNG